MRNSDPAPSDDEIIASIKSMGDLGVSRSSYKHWKNYQMALDRLAKNETIKKIRMDNGQIKFVTWRQ